MPVAFKIFALVFPCNNLRFLTLFFLLGYFVFNYTEDLAMRNIANIAHTHSVCT